MDLGTRINNRKKDLGLTTEMVLSSLGWRNRGMYYDRIKDESRAWKLYEICTLLNLFECTYSELFRYQNFEDTKINSIILISNPIAAIRKAARNKDVPREKLFKIFSTRQNFYARFKNLSVRISQINALLDLLDIQFEDVFCEIIKARIKIIHPQIKDDFEVPI